MQASTTSPDLIKTLIRTLDFVSPLLYWSSYHASHHHELERPRLISDFFPVSTNNNTGQVESRRTIHALLLGFRVRARVRVRARFFALPSLKPCVWLASPLFSPCCGSFFSFSFLEQIPSITSICCAVPCRRSLCCCCCVAVLLPRPLSLL